MHSEPEDDDLLDAVGEGGPTLTATIAFEATGKRFDQALAELFPEYSRSRLSEWIKSGQALLDGLPCRPRDPVRGGQTVSVAAVAGAQTAAQPEAIALSIAHADTDVLVIDKPAGLVVHPGAGNPHGTLVNALLHYDPQLAQVPRAGIVHRLDKDTSGLLVVARTLRAHAALVEQIATRQMHRQYVAVAMGAMIAGGRVDAPIGRHPSDRVRMAVVRGGRPAVTHYRVRERFRAHTVVECRLETGRTHQIRVHMAHIKHPLVGDPVYSRLANPRAAIPELVEVLRGFRRQALHAEKLAFAHPADGRQVVVEAPLPADMQALLAALRADASAHA